MKQPALLAVIALSLLLLVWYGADTLNKSAPAIQLSENFPGGDTTVSIRPRASFMLPASNLAQEKLPDYHAGKALANQPWIKAPTLTDIRDGLGPLFNARTCLTCHVNGGRGRMPENSEQIMLTNLLRLSVPGEDEMHGVVPEPVYGTQLQSQSTALSHMLRGKISDDNISKKDVPAEGYVSVSWSTETFTYPDGQSVVLRKPAPIIKQLGYGDMHPDTMIAIRNAPPLHGVGLLQLVPQSAIDKLADPEDKDGDGISGKLNWAWDFEANKKAPGRFGLKANNASLRIQVASALHGDMGISSPVFPSQNCTEHQTACNNSVHGNDENGFEIREKLLGLMIDFNMSMAVPERRKPDHPMVLQGRELFYKVACNRCHHPAYITAEDDYYPHLSNQKIWPYTDLLLHDMGEALADHRPDYLASGSEWRTPPLWGVGLGRAVNGSDNLLHDGRAQTVEQAILWHGGEAERSKQQFTMLNVDERKALIAFVKSL